MHGDEALDEVASEVLARWAIQRSGSESPELGQVWTAKQLAAAIGSTVTSSGIGSAKAIQLFDEVLSSACLAIDHPRFLAFVASAPTRAAVMFESVVAATSVYAGSWLEGSGAIFAENEVLRWIADLLGYPTAAGGVFVSGGTAGNLSALLAARSDWRHRSNGSNDLKRSAIVASNGAHSSVVAAARVMDADVFPAAADERGRLTKPSIRSALEALHPDDQSRVCAIVATAGTTNAGVVDDLDGIADIAEEFGLWLHVDGAYGGGALTAPSVRGHFSGIDRSDSFIVDPHKWLFAPYDSCALLYREPELARNAHTQNAAYLDVLHGDDPDLDWNASDYAHHLTRRARGLPLWFSLATHGTDAYRDAVETTLAVAHEGARLLEAAPHTELVLEPELSVVLFRRTGWTADDYQRWSDAELAAGTSFVTPTTWRGETVLRICIVNPRTTLDDVASIISSLADHSA